MLDQLNSVRSHTYFCGEHTALEQASVLHNCEPVHIQTDTRYSNHQDMRANSGADKSLLTRINSLWIRVNASIDNKFITRAKNRQLRLNEIAFRKTKIDSLPDHSPIKAQLLSLHNSLMDVEHTVKSARDLKWWTGTTANPFALFVLAGALITQYSAEGISAHLNNRIEKKMNENIL